MLEFVDLRQRDIGISCNHFAFGTIDRAFAGLLVKVDFCSVRINRTSATVRIEEEFTFRDIVVGAASVVLHRRETDLLGKLVVGTVGEGVFDTTLADRLTFYLEGALQGLDAFLRIRQIQG